MTRSEKVEASVVKAINSGYEFLGKGMGSQNEALESKRAEGYDVKAWYTQMKGDQSTWQWIMYGKKKGQRKSAQSKKVEIAFDTMNTKELKKLCSEKKIAGYSKMNKENMIQALREAC